MTSDQTAYRVRVLPAQLELARAKYQALVREARSLRMHDILTNEERVNEAWEREVELAKLARSVA